MAPVIQSLRPCCAELFRIVKAVAAAVIRIFSLLAAAVVNTVYDCVQTVRGYFIDRREDYLAPLRPVQVDLNPIRNRPVWDGARYRREAEERLRRNMLYIHDFHLNRINNRGLNQVDQVHVELVDRPVDLEPLRAILRNNGEVRQVQISKQMTARHFLELIDAFPDGKERIGRWAIAWAKDRQPKLNPNQPYYAIAQDALRFKDQLGGARFSNDLNSYSVADSGYYGEEQFPLVIKSIISFQELVNPDNDALIRRLDNGNREVLHNPAVEFANDLSKLYAHPEGEWRGEMVYDTSNTLATTYQLARDNRKLLEFFRDAFVRGAFCYNVRLTNFGNFAATILNEHNDEEFRVDIQATANTARRVGEHFRVFRNFELKRYADAQRLDYGQFKRHVDVDGEDEATRRFYLHYCTRARFEAYLQLKGQPIQENGRPITRAAWEAVLTPDMWGE